MCLIPDKSIDMILCDLPYGTTQNKWDSIIPFDKLWEQYKRVIKNNGAIVLTASQPFTSELVHSNLKMFKYEWIWEKTRPSNFPLAKKQPLKYHENICVFYFKLPTYNPQMWIGNNNHRTKYVHGKNNIIGDLGKGKKWINTSNIKYPKSIIKIKSTNSVINYHPTQKPITLFEYLIKTYTNEGETVLDNCMGSGTTAIACINTNRNYIGFEWCPDEPHDTYFKLANKRIEEHLHKVKIA